MKLFKLISTVGMAAAFIGLVAACSSSDSGGTGGGSAFDCASACKKCPGGGESACVSSCNAALKTSCSAQFSAVGNCQVSNACDITKCTTQYNDYVKCATSTDGGTGGTGQGGSGTGGSGTGGSSVGGSGQGGSSVGGSGQGGSSTGGSGQGGSSTGGSGAGGTGGGGSFTDLPESCAHKSAGWTNECNPVTNEPCNTAGGEDCDYTQTGWQCFPDANTIAEGGACGGSATEYCKPGLTCVMTDLDAGTGTCGKSCCSDADCGTKKCEAWDATQLGTFGWCI